MSLRVIYGKAGTGKSQFIFNEINDMISNTDENNKIFIITPEQFSFTAEKKLMEKKKSVLNAEVITFNRLAYRVMNEIGGITRSNLSNCGKAMLIYSILQDQKNNLIYLNKSDENIDLCIRTISEFKKHGLMIEDLKNQNKKIENKYLKNKLNDMIIIYEEFEKKIKEKYIDESDLLTILLENIDSVELLKDATVYIDEFSGFTEQEYLIIEKIIRIAAKVTITFCTDNFNDNTDVFYPNKITYKKIINLMVNNKKEANNNITENDEKIDKDKKLEKIYLDKLLRFKNDELKYIENYLFNNSIRKYELNVNNIRLFLAKNNYSEIENLAIKIEKLIKNDNIRYSDICVITKDIEKYSTLIKIIFKKYNIPVFIDEKRDLNQNLIIQYILSILDILIKNFSYDSIFNYLKTGFVDIDENDIFKLEKYCIKYGIKNYQFKEDFKYGINENNQEEIEYLNTLRKMIINPLLELKENINKNIIKNFYLFLQRQNIENKINKKISYLKKNNLLGIAKEYEESYKIIINILDEINLIFNNQKITIEQFSKLIKVGLTNSGLGKIPTMQDQVIVGDVDRSKSRKTKVVFIIGLNDGIFPNVYKNEGFFDDNDRNKLKEMGIELAKGTLENLYDDNLNIYKAFTTAEEKIFLSYASSDEEGKALRPSSFIFRLKKIFPKISEESDIISLNKNQKKNMVIINEKIKKENIKKIFGEKIYTSVSKLEKYNQCPFSYFLQYILKIKPREEFKIQSFDTGAFMHEVINSFFEEIYNLFTKNNLDENKEEYISNSNLKDISDEMIQELINKIIDEKLSNISNYIFIATEKYKLLVSRLKRIIIKSLKYIIQTLIQSEFDLAGTEVEFSDKGKYKPIVLKLDNGKTVEISGKIDRIDIAKMNNNKYVRIIDYKSSIKNIDLNEVYAGLQLQLITYLDAVCELEDFVPAGILYFNLIEQVVNLDKKISMEEIEQRIKNNFRMKGLILADVKVVQMHDNKLESGMSELVPAYIDKSGALSNKKSSIATEEEFAKLQRYINKTIKNIAKEIFEGNIDMKPYSKNNKTPCEYCSYKPMCEFNSGICKKEYRYIEKYTKDEILNKI